VFLTLPTPPAEVVIAGVVLWDVAIIWLIHRWSRRPEARHRFRAPKVPRSPRKKLWSRDDEIERVYRDLW
jgi:hypothetical protein